MFREKNSDQYILRWCRIAHCTLLRRVLCYNLNLYINYVVFAVLLYEMSDLISPSRNVLFMAPS